MIARWPARIPAGRTSGEPWMAMDLFPTFAEVAGFAPPGNLDGRSVRAILTAEKASLGDRPLYWEIPEKRLWQAVRLGHWKGVRQGMDQPLELYDLATDARERQNVAADHPEVAARLNRYLDSAHTPTPHWPAR
jgi:arylsulfatase A-like enzyme